IVSDPAAIMPVVPGSAEGTALRGKQAEVIEFPANFRREFVISRFDPPVPDASRCRSVGVMGVPETVADDRVILPQTVRHLVSPQGDGIGVFDWCRDVAPRLVYESDAQGEASLLPDHRSSSVMR